MADDEKRKYPNMPVGQWWALRKRFRSSIPKELSPTYLASGLGMGVESAKANILPSLRLTGLIDKDGKPTERAVRWRDDAQYAAVCDTIRNDVYPQELLDLAPDSSADRGVVQNWFLNHTGFGEAAAKKYASFYMLLLEADASKESEGAVQPSTKPRPVTPNERTRPTASQRREPAAPGKNEPDPQSETPHSRRGHSAEPTLHLNVQIHISPDASPEQIDQIFASMAKHLRNPS